MGVRVRLCVCVRESVCERESVCVLCVCVCVSVCVCLCLCVWFMKTHICMMTWVFIYEEIFSVPLIQKVINYCDDFDFFMIVINVMIVDRYYCCQCGSGSQSQGGSSHEALSPHPNILQLHELI